MKRVLAILAVILAVAAQTPAWAQTSETQIQILSLDENESGRVTMEIAIPASLGDLTPSPDRFAVVENGALPPVDVQRVETDVDVVLVIDTSGSMEDGALTAAKGAASSFLRRLPETARVGLVSFGDQAVAHQSPSTDRGPVLNQIQDLSADGDTALWDALVEAGDLLAEIESERPYVVLLSDGGDSLDDPARQTAAIDRLRQVGAGLYAVAIETAELDEPALDTAVDAVGGEVLTTSELGELDAIYGDIAGRLTNRYILSYTTTTSNARRVKVSVYVRGAGVATAKETLPGPDGPDPETTPAPGAIGPEDTAALGSAAAEALAAGPQLGLVPAPEPGALSNPRVQSIGLGLFFAAFVVLGITLMVPSGSNSTSTVRLGAAASIDKASGLNDRISSAAERFVSRRDTDGEIDTILDAAGLALRPGEFVLLSTVVVIMVSLVASFFGGLLAGVLVAVFGFIFVYLYLQVRIGRRRSKFADQLTDALGIMTGSLRSGRGLPQALELVAEEAPSPTAEQFQRIVFETRVGRDMTQSMAMVAKRMQSQDFEWVSRAVDINRELGGDLTEVLDNVAETIRERRRVARQVKALSAEGRMSGWVLLALPFVMFAFVAWRTPQNAALLFNTTAGLTMMIGSLINMVLGFLWIRVLVNIKY